MAGVNYFFRPANLIVAGQFVKLLEPSGGDYFILKPTHAGFYGTMLERLLKELKIKTLLLTGISAHQCILFTANEAYLPEFTLIVARDCVASKTLTQRAFALRYFTSVLHADVHASSHWGILGRRRYRM